MQNFSALKELTQKLDEIKEAWQIYTIFEEARKNFNEEFSALKKDKEALIGSYNNISAKNALLLAQNKELEATNKTLQESNAALEHTKNIKEKSDSNFKDDLENLESKKDFSNLYAQLQNLQEILKTSQETLKNIQAPEPVVKLEVSYQKHQRLLANPAKDYVLLQHANDLFNTLINVESKLKTLDLELAKLQVEMRDLFQNTQIRGLKTIQEQPITNSILLDSTNNDNP
ncbi:hypothetical protein [uncultured Helicobacter sp.]|uniref:hypothetical protein n=1 Tax=uncultured Helicobacter sp. TaxID=175537 RepID=UPI00262876FD|nr:hypothetical protein [uncultured Helicobacter sp.]